MDRSTSAAIEAWLTVHDAQPLAIVVTLGIQAIPTFAESIRQRFAFPSAHVGSELGEVLLDSKPGRRIRDVERWLVGQCREANDRPLLLTDVDLLFHPNLDPGSSARLDQLALFTKASRMCPLLVLWPGEFDGSTLSYAVPEHGHYRYWRNPQAHIIQQRAGI